jgi:hypothetical protein
MSNEELQDLCAATLVFMAVALVMLAIEKYGGLQGKIAYATLLFALSLGAIGWMWHNLTWRAGIAASLMFSSVWARDYILIRQSMMAFHSEWMPGYPWYLTTTAYYCICCGLAGLGFAFTAMVLLGREPEWMRELLD